MATAPSLRLNATALIVMAASYLGPVQAGQVQVTINGSPGSLCCGTVIAPQAYEKTYDHHFMYAPLQFAHEGATVSVDLATGLVKGSSFASGQTGVFWLAFMQEEFRIIRSVAGPGEFVSVGLSVRVNADPEWQPVGDTFQSIVSTAQLDFGRSTQFGLSEVSTAQWRHIWSRDATAEGATESYTTIPTGNVFIDDATENFFDITLNTSKSVFIGDNATESGLFGFNFFLNADIFTNKGGGVSFDASHTAQVILHLPAGFELASASGVFLTQPVPLPAPLWLLGMALPLMLAKSRRSARPQSPAGSAGG